jgi:hypothetical protein
MSKSSVSHLTDEEIELRDAMRMFKFKVIFFTVAITFMVVALIVCVPIILDMNQASGGTLLHFRLTAVIAAIAVVCAFLTVTITLSRR